MDLDFPTRLAAPLSVVGAVYLVYLCFAAPATPITVSLWSGQAECNRAATEMANSPHDDKKAHKAETICDAHFKRWAAIGRAVSQ